MSILIKDVLLDGKKTDIYVEGERIAAIGRREKAEYVIDGSGKAAIPGLVNTHTHAAMTLFRSYADDMRLHEWLSEKIWPVEAKLTEEDVYWGTKLACLEMIKSGTTAFSDMYWHRHAVEKASSEMGLRAAVSGVFLEFSDPEKREETIKRNMRELARTKSEKNPLVIPSLGPHAIYTVSEEGLVWVKEYADKEGIIINFHLAETEKENRDFQEKTGMRPVPFLEKIGFLGPNLICAHCIYLDETDQSILARHGVKISHNPTSNMKLSSGVMPYGAMKKAGLSISLGTDGCASNNNLDMFEAMKLAALLQKVHTLDPLALPAAEAFAMATANGAQALGIDAGLIAEGKLADIVLVDLRRPEMTPKHNLTANLVYSAGGSCVDSVICNGRILMEGRVVEGEDETLDKAQESADGLFSR